MTPDTEKTDWVLDVLAKAGIREPLFDLRTNVASAVDPLQVVLAQTTYLASDWSDPARAVWRNDKARAQAIVLLNSTDPLGKALRGEVAALLDDNNVLRAQIVGVGTITFDPPNMANGAGTTSALIPIVGAAFGDVVDVAAPYDLLGIVATGYVKQAGNVVIRLHNGTGAAVNLLPGTWKVVVRRHVALPERTLVQARTAIQNKINAGIVDG